MDDQNLNKIINAIFKLYYVKVLAIIIVSSIFIILGLLVTFLFWTMF